MNILVTGGAGYVGSVLLPELVKDGHNIKCLDRFFFGTEYLSQKQFQGKIELVRDDIRWFEPEILKDVDIVMDLAALSNDPVGALEPEKTYQINHLGRARVAKLSKETGVKQYILASSASVYGQQKDVVNEDSTVNPITDYSKANRKAELDILPLGNEDFSVTALRFSSIYGMSSRMRFDLAINGMVLDFFKNKKITIFGGNNKRPFVHILDAVNAYKLVLNTSVSKINKEIFNVGSNDQNFVISDLAKKVGSALDPNCTLDISNTPDERSYFASFDKIQKILNFKVEYTVENSSKEMLDALEINKLDYGEKTITLKWYNHIKNNQILLKQHSINGNFL